MLVERQGQILRFGDFTGLFVKPEIDSDNVALSNT